MNKMKSLGLALGGGGLKGFAHIGVLQVLEDNRIPVSYLSGTSAGALVAALYASGLSAYQIEALTRALKPSDYLDYNISGLIKWVLSRYIPGLSASLDGIIKGDKITGLVDKWTRGKTLKDCQIPICIIACDIDTGREVVFTNQDIEFVGPEYVIIRDASLSEAVRASISIPAAFVPLDYADMQMVDGGLKSMVPVLAQKVMGADYVLAVNLGTQLYSEGVSGIPAIVTRSLSILTYETSDAAQHMFADMAIYPGIDDVDLDDVDQGPAIIRAGRRAMKSQLEKLEKDLWGG